VERSAFGGGVVVAITLLALHLTGQPAGSQLAEAPSAAALVAVPALDVNVPRPHTVPTPAAGAAGAVAPAESSESAVRVSAPAAGNGITLTSLHDGATLTPGEPPFVIVEGRVEDVNGAGLWLVANDRRIAVPVRDGRFRQALPLLEKSLVVWAETRTSEGRLDRWSRPVTVTAAVPKPAGVVLVVEWPEQLGGSLAEIRALWRERPERPARGQPVTLAPFRTGADRPRPEVFCLEPGLAGVYTFLLRYEGARAGGEVRILLHAAEGGRLRTRERRLPVAPGAGTLVLGRLLLPHGVHWEQDEWFTGKSESGDVVAKFRFPEGITWSERKVDVD
jgi:hypothetical protein